MKTNSLLHLFFSILMISFFMLSSSYVNAIVIVFDNNTDYTSTVGAELFSIDFNASPGTYVDGSTIDPNVIFSSPEAISPNLVLWNSDAISDAGSTTALNYVGPVALDFVDTEVYGFSFVSSSSGQYQTIDLYDNSDVLMSSVLSPSNSGFFGFVSDVAIGSATVIPGEFDDGYYDRFFIDDLTANTNSIPEPSTLALLGIGLLGLSFFNRKTNKPNHS